MAALTSAQFFRIIRRLVLLAKTTLGGFGHPFLFGFP
jgi:hypothetical protein